jgi:hypothetical protein
MRILHSSVWGGIIGVAIALFWMIRGWRAEEKKRKEANQPHTFRDDALLLVAALLVVGLMMLPVFYEPLRIIFRKPMGPFMGSVMIVALAYGLTYVFNHKRKKSGRPQ